MPATHLSEDAKLVLKLSQMVNVEITETQAKLLVRYGESVISWNKIANLTGATTLKRYITDHIVDCLAVVPFLDKGSILDIGSGAGLPGLIFGIVAPQRRVVLIEPRRKRCRFLVQMKVLLNLEALDVVPGRVENYTTIEPFRYVISRAFGSLSEFISKSRHLMGAETELVAMKASVESQDLSEAEALLGPARCVQLSVPSYNARNLIFVKKSTTKHSVDTNLIVP